MLEGRHLLSVVSPIRSTPVEVLVVDQKAVVVVAPALVQPDGASTSQETEPANSLVAGARALTVNVTSANPPASPASVAISSSTNGIVRRSNAKKSPQRQLLDSAPTESRSSDLGSHEPAFEGAQNGSDLLFGASGGDVSDSAAVASAVGSVPEGAMSLVTSAANAFGDSAALDADLGLGAAESPAPTGSSGTVVLVLDRSIFSPGESRAVSGLRGDESRSLVFSAASLVFSSPELLDAAVNADWEAVDGELRQFLARLGGLAGSAHGRPSRSLWLAWIGAAGALVVARRASRRGRPLFRRSLIVESSAGRGHGPFPVGPWPLGLP